MAGFSSPKTDLPPGSVPGAKIQFLLLTTWNYNRGSLSQLKSNPFDMPGFAEVKS